MRRVIAAILLALALPVQAETFNIWLALTDVARDEFIARRAAERNETEYTGPMDNTTYRYLQRMQDLDTVQRLFKSPSIGGKTYYLYSMYVSTQDYGAGAIAGAVDHMTTTYPSNIIVVGAWNMAGDCVGGYGVHAQAWRLMPDRIEYDANGDVVSTTPASSNADLRDVNLLMGQSPRDFSC